MLFQSVVAKFAAEKIAPLVSEMDVKGEMDKSILQAMFDQGVRPIKFWIVFLLSDMVIIIINLRTYCDSLDYNIL